MSVNMFTTSLFVKAYILTLSLKLNGVVPSFECWLQWQIRYIVIELTSTILPEMQTHMQSLAFRYNE